MSGSSCKGSVTITSRGRILKVSDKEIKLATRAFFAPSLDTFFFSCPSPDRTRVLHTARPMISEEMDGALYKIKTSHYHLSPIKRSNDVLSLLEQGLLNIVVPD